MVVDRPIAVTAGSDVAWRRRRTRWGIAVILLTALSLTGVMAVIVTPESIAGAFVRRLVPLQVARGGSSFRSAAVSYTVFDNGTVSRDDLGSVMAAAMAVGEPAIAIHVQTSGTRTRHGFWALTQENLHFRVDVASVFPEYTAARHVDAIMDRAMLAIVEDFLQSAPDWWFQKEPAAFQNHRSVSRIRWSGLVQNLATLIIVVLLPLAFAMWIQARKIHQRLHAIVVKKECPKCGYSLIGNEHSRCPECGEACRVP